MGESRFDLDTIAFLVVVALLVVGGTWFLVRSGDTQPSTNADVVGIIGPSPSPSPSASAKPQTTGAPVVNGELRITAPKGDSWLEVRRDGATGTVLFSGTVTKGKTRVFAGNVLWLRLRDPSRVRLRVEGRRVKPMTDRGPVNFIVKNGKLERQG